MQPSARRGIQYPSLDRSDRPDIPAHIKNLIDALELDMIYGQGTSAIRMAASHMQGTFFYETDTKLTYYDDGTIWHQISNLGRYGGQFDVDWIPVSDAGLKTMYTQIVKGGDLASNGQLYIDAIGYIRSTSVSHPQLTMSMSWGGSPVFTQMVPGFNGSNQGGPTPFHLQIWILSKDPTHQLVQYDNDMTAWGNNSGKTEFTTTVINTAVDQSLVLTGQFAGSAASTNQLHLNQLIAQVR